MFPHIILKRIKNYIYIYIFFLFQSDFPNWKEVYNEFIYVYFIYVDTGSKKWLEFKKKCPIYVYCTNGFHIQHYQFIWNLFKLNYRERVHLSMFYVEYFAIIIIIKNMQANNLSNLS